MKFKKTDNLTLNRIKDWIINPDTDRLTDAEKELFEKIDFADNILRKYPSKKIASAYIQRKYQCSLATAYNYMSAALDVFNSKSRLDKEFWKNWIIYDIAKLIAKAEVKEDFKSWALAQKNLITVMGFDRPDEDKYPPSIFDNNNFYVAINVNNKLYKSELNKFLELPLSSRNTLIKNINKNQIIDEFQAAEIIES
jgi:hypothetical protein